MRAIGLVVGLWCLALLAGGAPPAHAQPDSARAAILKAKGFSPDHSPRGAAWRAAAVPGWGQFYNRQYLKIPFVYAGLAAAGYAVHTTNQNYTLYRHAAIYKRGQSISERGDDVPDVISNWEAFQDEYEEVVSRVGAELGARRLRDTRDQYRRWRDLSIVGTGLFYALTILDAYVSAHLLTFNVGDLDLQVQPVGGLGARGNGTNGRTLSSGGGTGGAGLRVRVDF